MFTILSTTGAARDSAIIAQDSARTGLFAFPSLQRIEKPAARGDFCFLQKSLANEYIFIKFWPEDILPQKWEKGKRLKKIYKCIFNGLTLRAPQVPTAKMRQAAVNYRANKSIYSISGLQQPSKVIFTTKGFIFTIDKKL